MNKLCILACLQVYFTINFNKLKFEIRLFYFAIFLTNISIEKQKIVLQIQLIFFELLVIIFKNSFNYFIILAYIPLNVLIFK